MYRVFLKLDLGFLDFLFFPKKLCGDVSLFYYLLPDIMVRIDYSDLWEDLLSQNLRKNITQQKQF